MTYPLTKPSVWLRTVAWIMLLLLPAYASAVSWSRVEPKVEVSSQVVKAIEVDVSAYEANRALNTKTGPDGSAETRPLLLMPGLPAEGVRSTQRVETTSFETKTQPQSLWRGLKTSLQLFYCVFLI